MSATTQKPKEKEKSKSSLAFALDKKNYILVGIGLFFIVVGFIVMSGGGSDDPNKFSEKLFDFRRLTLAPILVLIGYVIEIFAIMLKFNDTKQAE